MARILKRGHAGRPRPDFYCRLSDESPALNGAGMAPKIGPYPPRDRNQAAPSALQGQRVPSASQQRGAMPPGERDFGSDWRRLNAHSTCSRTTCGEEVNLQVIPRISSGAIGQATGLPAPRRGLDQATGAPTTRSAATLSLRKKGSASDTMLIRAEIVV
jgi:hypothetical protein